MKLLHIDSSILGAHSVSRVVSADVVAREKSLHPGLDVTCLDLAANPVQHLSAAHMAAFQGGAVGDPALAADLAAGAAYIDALFATDILVIGAPMYNFGIPTQLKAWFDRVMVAGKTFRYGENGAPIGLVTGKRAVIASSRGGVYTPGAPAAPFDHQESYLLAALAFIGITDVTIVRAEGVAMGPEAKAAALAKAHEAAEALAA